MSNEKIIQPLGYTEMYEWVRAPKTRYGRFVQFSKRYPDKIELYHDTSNVLAGVSTIVSTVESDNPKQWKYAYMCNDIGDIMMKEETLAVGIKVYDQQNEFSYITTRPWKHYVKIPSSDYDEKLKYIPRTNRNEWTRVTLLGKTIVHDNGVCIPGQYCMPYIGNDIQKYGTAVKWDGSNANHFYVLERISENTVLIVVNSFTGKGEIV